MTHEILNGASAKLYEIVAPFAMSRQVVAEFNGYPLFTDDKHTWFIVKNRMELLGFAAVRLFDSHAEFTNDYVLPEHRKKGVHKKLIEDRIVWCRENKTSFIKADCTNECLSHYQKAGFKVIKSYVKWHKVELAL